MIRIKGQQLCHLKGINSVGKKSASPGGNLSFIRRIQSEMLKRPRKQTVSCKVGQYCKNNTKLKVNSKSSDKVYYRNMHEL